MQVSNHKHLSKVNSEIFALDAEFNRNAIAAIRKLSIDQIQQANSGHPGIALGAAPIIYSVFANFLHFNVKDPHWKGRDRFVLSAGHGSALYYSVLLYFGYFVTVNDLKKFRKLNSVTPGHPRYWSIPGVETTSGPLGQGIANAVGMAFSSEWLRRNIKLDTDKKKSTSDLFDNFTYVLCGDGCLQEGIAYESMSFAGHHQLNHLILLYDSNDVQLDGPSKDSFSENIKQRAESQGWEYFKVSDGDSYVEISNAISAAQTSSHKGPKFIEVKTIIGKHSPLENKNTVHGAPFSQQDYQKTVESLGFDVSKVHKFSIDYKILQKLSGCLQSRTNPKYSYFVEQLNHLEKNNIDAYNQFIHKNTNCMYKDLFDHDKTRQAFTPLSSRDIVGSMLEIIATKNRNFIGGSADLASSTRIGGIDGTFSNVNFAGREIKYGVRENAMVAINTGINLFGCQNAYGASFLTFADNAKLSTRLAAMIHSRNLIIYSHDSIFVGEDGETHQPVEQLGALRAIPMLDVWRPYNQEEVATVLEYYCNSNADNWPTVIITSRQKYQQIPTYQNREDIQKGGYVIRYETVHAAPKIIIFASGSEVETALRVAQMLEGLSISTRVISVPCLTRFLEPRYNFYLKEILFNYKPHFFVIEASNCTLWYKLLTYTSQYKNFFNVNKFGCSATGADLQRAFHLTPISIFKQIWKKIYDGQEISINKLGLAIQINKNMFSNKSSHTLEAIQPKKSESVLTPLLSLFKKRSDQSKTSFVNVQVQQQIETASESRVIENDELTESSDQLSIMNDELLQSVGGDETKLEAAQQARLAGASSDMKMKSKKGFLAWLKNIFSSKKD